MREIEVSSQPTPEQDSVSNRLLGLSSVAVGLAVLWFAYGFGAALFGGFVGIGAVLTCIGFEVTGKERDDREQ
jgi:hypothetical protein